LRLAVLFILADLRLERLRQRLALVELLFPLKLLLLLVGIVQPLLRIFHVLVKFSQRPIPRRIDVLFAGIGRHQGQRAAALFVSRLLVFFLLCLFGIAPRLLRLSQRRFDILRNKAAIVTLLVGPALTGGRQKVTAHLAAVAVVAAIDAYLGSGVDGKHGRRSEQQGGNQAHGVSP